MVNISLSTLTIKFHFYNFSWAENWLPTFQDLFSSLKIFSRIFFQRRARQHHVTIFLWQKLYFVWCQSTDNFALQYYKSSKSLFDLSNVLLKSFPKVHELLDAVVWKVSGLLKVSEFLDAVVADVCHDQMSIAHHCQAGGSLELAAVRIDGRIETSARQVKDLKTKNHCNC